MNFLKIFPDVFRSVVEIERAYSDLPGAVKKKIFLLSLTGLAKVGETIPVPMVQAISLLVDSIVSALNDAGVFAPKAPPVVAAP